jgi:glycosyltransferase involved in cell wall biosynthesis
MSRPRVSVIVPALNATATLRQTFSAILASDLPREQFELILCDDGSTDETSLVGAEFCDVVVRLSGKPHGPAYARNRASEASRGEIIVFVDADVVVHPDALRRIVDHLDADPELSAVFGSYDSRPTAPGLVSQYRNLLHHYVHTLGRGPAETFWAGLGAIRASAFEEAGRFDEWHYSRPQIEDIELGRRLRLTGHSIRLDPDIQGTHLKRWTFGGTFSSDFRHRGVPWMWLILKEGVSEDTQVLNVRTRESLLTAAAGMWVPLALIALIRGHYWPLLVALALYLVILAANLPFYAFLARQRGILFALAAIPLHLGYYALNAVSVVMGWFVHLLFGEPIPPPTSAAHAQIGIATWPPPPRRSQQSVWETPPGGRPKEDR